MGNVKSSTERIQYLIRKQNLQFDAYMLTGSQADGKATDQSDVDILALSKYCNHATIENFIDQNIEYQFIILPYHKIVPFLILDIYNIKSAHLSMIGKGIILQDTTDNILFRLQTHIRKHTLNSPQEEQKLRCIRFKISELVNDLTPSSTKEENLFIVIDIVRWMGELISFPCNHHGKQLARVLAQHQTERDLLLQSFDRFVREQDVSVFSSQIRQMLRHYGGEILDYSTNHAISFPYVKEYVTVQCPDHSIFQSQFRELLHILLQQLKEYPLCCFYVGRDQFMERGIYLSVHCGKEKYDSLIRLLDIFFRKHISGMLRQNLRFSYPFQTTYHEGLFWGGRDAHNKLAPYFCKLSKLLITDIRHREVQTLKQNLIKLSFCVLVRFGKAFFNSRKYFAEFCNYHMESMFSETLDPNNIYNCRQLPIVAGEISKIHQVSFLHQKKSYETLFYHIWNERTDEPEYDRWSVELSIYLRKMDFERIMLPVTLNKKDKRFFVIKEILNHVLGIFHLEPHEKFSILYNLRKTLETHYGDI